MTSSPAATSIPISLRRLFPGASFVGCGDIVVTDATERSGDCRAGSLFAALPGTNVHGSAFVAEAARRGATALLVDRPIPDVLLPQCVVRDARSAYARLCHALYQWPSRKLGVAGVTGTNGKTSTTWLIRSMLRQAGFKTGLLGTIEYHDGEEALEATLTTPDARSLARLLASARARGSTHVALELSSHALDQRRAAGLQLDVAIITNITQDHFDYHGSFAAYRQAKAGIAGLLKPGGAFVLNADDSGSRELLGLTPSDAQAVTFGIERDAGIRGSRLEETPSGCRFTVTAGSAEAEFETSLIGKHNVANVLAAVAAGLHFGLDLPTMAAGVRALTSIPGRLQRIEVGQPFSVFVDYAHTDDALRRALAAVRQVTSGRVICVFGAGGDRDRRKRPAMGLAASAADQIVLTSDNPRSEDPMSILQEIRSGCTIPQTRIEPDREQAIGLALSLAQPGDAVLVAGKGHEREQVIGDTRIPFDDAAICSRLLSHWGAPDPDTEPSEVTA